MRHVIIGRYARGEASYARTRTGSEPLEKMPPPFLGWSTILYPALFGAAVLLLAWSLA